MVILTFYILVCICRGKFYNTYVNKSLILVHFKNSFRLCICLHLIRCNVRALFSSSVGAQFEVFPTSLPWIIAKSRCEDKHGYLAHIQESARSINISQMDADFQSHAMYWVGGHLLDNGWHLYDNRCYNTSGETELPVIITSLNTFYSL